MIARIVSRATVAAVLVLASAPAARACAVCFGESDSPLAKGLHWGVIALLLIVGAVLSGFAFFAVYLVRRAAATAAAPTDLDPDSDSP